MSKANSKAPLQPVTVAVKLTIQEFIALRKKAKIDGRKPGPWCSYWLSKILQEK